MHMTKGEAILTCLIVLIVSFMVTVMASNARDPGFTYTNELQPISVDAP